MKGGTQGFSGTVSREFLRINVRLNININEIRTEYYQGHMFQILLFLELMCA